MNAKSMMIIDNMEIAIEGEHNVLEVARKAGIEIPTFCYHSELSVYGACRMCLVEIAGRGIVASCSTPPEPGMQVKTTTDEIRKLRRINLELLLAAHQRECTTCGKSGSCSLQKLSHTMGVDSIRYKQTPRKEAIDMSSPSLVRDPNKCVLCGDCVRFCDEIQSVGAIDFAFRGAETRVVPAFNKDLADVDCVNCGQCARVCPTGAITPRPEIEAVWQDLGDPDTVVVAQVAPAIRVALAEHFGFADGSPTTGAIATALRRLGFDRVYDTCFTADLTVLEEGAEFIKRVSEGGQLPQFTSCCPAWVKFAEQYYPDLIGNLSSCKSPQQMFGALAKEMLPAELKLGPKKLSVVSVMPCTAKKFEARRPEFRDAEGRQQVDHVITTQELARMIETSGIRFDRLEPSEFDQPFGIASGAGAIFGVTGGVTEAVLRNVYEKMTGDPFTGTLENGEQTRQGVREVSVTIGDTDVRIAVVYGLRAAGEICREVREGKSPYALIEVMACPGGCVNGAGQPVTYNFETVKKRGKSLYAIDRNQVLRTAQENPVIAEVYEKVLGEVGGPVAHHLLHTHYVNRRRIDHDGIALDDRTTEALAVIEICVGTNCCLNGAHDLLKQAMAYVQQKGLSQQVTVKAVFCFERCGESPVAKLGEEIVGKCTFEKIRHFIDARVTTAMAG